MVTIVGFKSSINQDGEEFFSLILQGKIEMVKSQTTGDYYATARKARISSTFSEEVCESLVGTQMAGEIVKEACEPYEYTIEQTGEIIELSHQYKFIPEGEKSNSRKSVQPLSSFENSFSENGVLETA